MVIEFAIDHYNRFLALCDPASREYEIVKNGLVIRRVKNGNRQYERVVEIFAEMRDAYLLLDMANKICPDAMPAITKAVFGALRVASVIRPVEGLNRRLPAGCVFPCAI